MAEKTKLYEDSSDGPNRGGTGTSSSGTGQTKIYEQKNKIWTWLLPLLLIIAGLIIWGFMRGGNHQNQAATTTPVATQNQTAGVQDLPDLHFAPDQATLTPESQATLQQAVSQMNRNPNLKMRIEGYTDATGNPAHNQALSEQRAAAVGQFMTSKGIDRSRLTGEGFGESAPVNTNATAAGKADNRRVKIQLFQ